MINKNNELAMIKRMAQEGEQLEKQQKVWTPEARDDVLDEQLKALGYVE